jgi:hypothetical protein
MTAIPVLTTTLSVREALAGLPMLVAAPWPWWLALGSFVFGVGATLMLVRRALRGISDAGEGCGPVIPSLRAQLPTYVRELDRVRRYDRSLAIVVLKLEDPRTLERAFGLLEPEDGRGLVSEDPDALVQAARQVMFWNVGYVLSDIVRENDLVACDLPNRRHIVLLPESEEEDAQETAGRLAELILESVDVRVRRGVAVYRMDGLTITDLIESATAMCERMQSGRPSPRVRSRPGQRVRRLPDRKSSS